jgi:hypothetical protein
LVYRRFDLHEDFDPSRELFRLAGVLGARRRTPLGRGERRRLALDDTSEHPFADEIARDFQRFERGLRTRRTLTRVKLAADGLLQHPGCSFARLAIVASQRRLVGS